MKYEDSGIMFNNVDGFVYPLGHKVASSSFTVDFDKLEDNNYKLSESEIGGKVDFGAVNVVNVDWNGADINGIIINTTGQLLSIIKDIQEKQSTIATFVTAVMDI